MGVRVQSLIFMVLGTVFLAASLLADMIGIGGNLTVIGWNVINISVLVHLLYRQVRDGQAAWLQSTQATARLAMIAYIGWTVFLILAIPWLFR